MATWEDIRASALVEDAALLALDKPAGISVTGEQGAPDLAGMARGAGEDLRPVHRIDKVTSGIVLFAKTPESHAELTRQFNLRTVDKAYLTITQSTGLPAEGRIELPLSRGRKGRVRIAAPRERIVSDAATGVWSVRPGDVLPGRVYPAVTEFSTLWSDGRHSVLEVRPVTGRRHQIRVHMAWIGHAILGDPLFDEGGGRTYLHSWRLAFDASWRDPGRVVVEALPAAEFWEPVAARVGEPWPARLPVRA